MAFLPEKTYIEEIIANSYNLTSGPTNFQSSDLSRFMSFSLHFGCNDILGDTAFCIEQSNDGTNWATLSDNYELDEGDTNFIIDKSYFTGKYLRVCIISASSGTLTIKLISKR